MHLTIVKSEMLKNVLKWLLSTSYSRQTKRLHCNHSVYNTGDVHFVIIFVTLSPMRRDRVQAPRPSQAPGLLLVSSPAENAAADSRRELRQRHCSGRKQRDCRRISGKFGGRKHRDLGSGKCPEAKRRDLCLNPCPDALDNLLILKERNFCNYFCHGLANAT